MVKRQARVTLISLDRNVDKIDRSVRGLNLKIDMSVARLDNKVEASVKTLHDKIDTSVQRLTGKFVRLEKKVDRLDHKIAASSDEGKRHASDLFEQTKEEIQKVAKGVAALNEKIGKLVDRTPHTENDADMLKLGYRDLDRRVTHLEAGRPAPRRP